MPRRRIYIPTEVKEKIKEHLNDRYNIALDGYYSASEDEDTLTGDLGATLRVKNQKVEVLQSEINGTWTWAINYTKFRGRGNKATETMIGADGIIELELQFGRRIERKSILFQSKMNWEVDYKLMEQVIFLTTWREASFVLNYEPNQYSVFNLDTVLDSQGKKPSVENVKNIAEYLGSDFLDCLVGDVDLNYDAVKRLLKWRAIDGITVATKFSIPHKIAIKIKAPLTNFKDYFFDKEINNEDIHNYRMDASFEEILSLPNDYKTNELNKYRNKIALLYHPDKYNLLDEIQKNILNKRMQEINNAYDEVKKRKIT